MPKEILTDEQVVREIERLTTSEAVRLARAEQRIKYRRRQYLYTLRHLEKRGFELMAQGMTAESAEGVLDAVEAEIRDATE